MYNKATTWIYTAVMIRIPLIVLSLTEGQQDEENFLLLLKNKRILCCQKTMHKTMLTPRIFLLWPIRGREDVDG